MTITLKEDVHDYLKLLGSIHKDDSIERKGYYHLSPASSMDYSTNNEIQIATPNKDSYDLIHESQLIIRGKIKSTTETAFVNATCPTFTNNGPLHLFRDISLVISEQRIETVEYPGIATLLDHITFNNKPMPEMMLLPDKIKRMEIIPKLCSTSDIGSFEVRIPLDKIFGFCATYRKIIPKSTKKLVFHRKRDNHDADALERETGAPDGEVVIEKIIWKVPFVECSPYGKLKIAPMIEQKISYEWAYYQKHLKTYNIPAGQTGFRQEILEPACKRPYFAIVAFQENRKNSQEKDNSVFDHVNIGEIYMTINTFRYPHDGMKDLDFSSLRFIDAYNEMLTCRNVYFNELFGRENDSRDIISLTDFKSKYPLFVFDLSKQKERQVISGQMNITLDVKFKSNSPANLDCHILLISKTILSFNLGDESFVVHDL